MPDSHQKVAVLMGGFSNEREISLKSGQAVLTALLSKGVDAHAFDPKIQDLSELKKQGFSVAFNMLHGTYGEDGSVQGALNALGIAYTGCGVLASAIAMDKYRSKLIWQALGLPVPEFFLLNDNSNWAQIEQELGLPLFIKPNAEGSSVGVHKVKQTGELKQRYEQLRQQFPTGEILAERNIPSAEYTCSILNDQALPCIRIIAQNEFYDYSAKYQRNDTVYLCPSDLSPADEQLMKDLALQAFGAIGGSGFGRVDFLQDSDGKLLILEVNTIPGMTDTSLMPKAAKQVGMEFADLCLAILQSARLNP